MDLEFSEEQKMLRQTARDFLEAECPKALVKEMAKDERGYTPELWRKMAAMGWMGLAFPEEYGGAGGDFLDLAILLEEMGRACLPGPFFSTVVLGGLAILEAGNERQRSEFLPKIAGGSLILTLALTEPGTTKYDPSVITVKATADNDNYVIDGTKRFVPDANVADYIVCVTSTQGEAAAKDGVTLFLVDAKSEGISYILLETIARDKQCEVIFDKVKVPKENMLGECHRGWRHLEKLLQKAAIAKCAEMIGGAQYVLEMATSYAKERIQFGQPVGSFQAIQHHCADMLIDTETSKAITYQVAWMLNRDMPAKMEVAVAKAWVSDAYQRVTTMGHQVIGGVAFTEDHDMPLYFRRDKEAELAFGDAAYYEKVVEQEMGLWPGRLPNH